MSFEDWQKQNQQIAAGQTSGFETWQAENQILESEKRGLIPEFGAALGRGAMTVGKGAVGLHETLTKVPYVGAWSAAHREEELAETREWLGRISAAQARIPPTRTDPAGWAANVIGETIPYMGAALAGGYMAGPLGAAGVGFATEGQLAYEEAISGGATEAEAQTDRVIVGSINAAIESLQISRLMKFHKAGKGSFRGFVRAAKDKAWREMRKQGVGFGSEILKTAVEEGIEEALQEGVSIAVPGLARGDVPRRPDGSIDSDAIVQRVGGAALGGMVAGGVLGGAGAGIWAGAEAATPSRARVEKAAKAIQESKLSDYEKARGLQALESLLPIKGKAEPINWEQTKGKLLAEEIGEWEEGQWTPIDKEAWEENELKPIIEKVKKNEGAEAANIVRDLLYLGIDTIDTHSTDGIVSVHVPESWKNSPNFQHNFSILNSPPNTWIEHFPKWGYQINIKTKSSIFAVSDTTKRRMETAKKFETVLIDLEAKRPKLRKVTKEHIGEKLEKMKEIFEDPDIADDPVAASRIARGMVKGFAREQIPELTEQISRDEVTDLFQAIRESNLPRGDLASLMTFFEAIKAGVQPHRSHIKIFDKFFGTNILKQTPKSPQGAAKVFSYIAEPFNLVKAIVCSTDFSAGGIQALMVLPNHPVIWAKGVGKGYRAFFSPEYVNLTELEMRTNPNFGLIQAHAPKLITEVGSKTKGEEYFVSELARRIPIVGRLVRASDRAFVTTLNYIRTNLFYQFIEQNPGASKETIGEMLDHIGNLTGRGRGIPGGRFERYAPELGAVLWAPRLYLGTFRTMTDWARKPHIRKIAAGNLVQATGFLLGILGLASLDPDNEVELDPRSTDFGKIKRGNTRIAFFGRHTQMIRTVAQLMLAQKKATSTGRIHSRKRMKIATQFIRSKLNPAAGTFWDVATGRTFLGERVRWRESEFTSKYIYEHITPMFLQDITDAIRHQGWGTALWTSPLGVHGIGVQTYEIHASGESAQLKNHYAHQYFGADWDQLGPETQKALRESQPLIEIYEDRARIERSKYAHENWTDEEQQEAGRKVLKGLSKNIQKELDRLDLPFAGLSRRISSRWFLNQERYKQYQKDTKELINRTVPALIESPGWKDLTTSIQRDMLEEIIKECKKAVRQKIINQAKFEDLERIISE